MSDAPSLIFDVNTLFTKFTIALAGWSGSCSAKMWHWLWPLLDVGFLATNPKIRDPAEILPETTVVLLLAYLRFLSPCIAYAGNVCVLLKGVLTHILVVFYAHDKGCSIFTMLDKIWYVY